VSISEISVIYFSEQVGAAVMSLTCIQRPDVPVRNQLSLLKLGRFPEYFQKCSVHLLIFQWILMRYGYRAETASLCKLKIS
jgi:hypothetical protein